ncbi:3696_t:CDS:2 [Entrophospora sp. SA101]|nr:3696_t:CDS:2 [Entrophospora sp. SA101]
MSLFEVPDWNLGELITQKPETNKNNSKRKHRKNKISKDKKKKSYDEKVKNVDKNSVVESWPKNPVDIFIEYLKQKPKNLIVADLGCGEAKIAKEAPNKILSFDFVAKNDKIIVCDIAKILFFDIVIFSLSLMGTNYIEFLKEAHRVLKPK